MKAAFAGSFAGSIIEPVRTRLSIPCDLVADDEARILRHLPDTDILVSMAFTAQMAEVAPNLRLVQVPGAGLDRIERVALRPGVKLANAYGHDTGIAEYIIGGMIALTRSFARLDASLRQGRWDSQWAVGSTPPPLSPELAGKTWEFWASDASVRRWPGARPHSKCGFAQSDAIPRPGRLTALNSSAARSVSTSFCQAPTIWPSRCRFPPTRAA